MFLIYNWLFFGMLLVSVSTAESIVVNVQHLAVMVGQSVKLHCPVNHPESVKWLYVHVGTINPDIIYYGGFGLFGRYRAGGRHSIEVGTIIDLMIMNVTDADAGMYTCEDNETEEPVDVYDIVILKSVPTCGSNIDLADVMGGNDCGIEPDLLRLHCSVVSSGNFAPRLRWQNSGGEQVMIGTNVSTPIRVETNDYSTESILTVTANMRLNDTYFTCQVADSQFVGIVPECKTPKVTVHCERKMKVRPENIAVIVGEEATFSFYFGNYKPQWRYTPTKALPITRDGYNVTPHFHPYITLNTDRQNNSNLIINETLLEHAGEYHAHSAPELGGIQGAQLIVLVSHPTCHSNADVNSHDEIHISHSRTIEMVCTVQYRGNWAPSMKWELHSVDEPTRGRCELGNGTEIYQARIHVTSETVTSIIIINSSSSESRICRLYFTCTTYFTEKIWSCNAGNIPNYTHIWTSPLIQYINDQKQSGEPNAGMFYKIFSAILVTTITITILVVIYVWTRKNCVKAGRDIHVRDTVVPIAPDASIYYESVADFQVTNSNPTCSCHSGRVMLNKGVQVDVDLLETTSEQVGDNTNGVEVLHQNNDRIGTCDEVNSGGISDTSRASIVHDMHTQGGYSPLDQSTMNVQQSPVIFKELVSEHLVQRSDSIDSRVDKFANQSGCATYCEVIMDTP